MQVNAQILPLARLQILLSMHQVKMNEVAGCECLGWRTRLGIHALEAAVAAMPTLGAGSLQGHAVGVDGGSPDQI